MKYAFLHLLFGLCLIGPLAAQLPTNTTYYLPSEIEAWRQQDTTPWKDQRVAWLYSYIGEYRQTLKIWDTVNGGRRSMTPADSAWFARFQPQDALSYIESVASGHQIIILNEAHHQPRHRVFTTQLLQALYQQGFRYLALEDLGATDTLLPQRGYPVRKTGFYMAEPRFGNLVRQALAIGYTLWPYEARGNGEREQEQAQNLKKLFEQDKNAKVLVHCGFDHVIEGVHDYWGKAMAGWFKEFTGIDPLTINQTNMTERSTERRSDPHWQKVQLPYSAVFVDSLQQPFNGLQGKNQFDLVVFHPRTTWVEGRPDWLVSDSGKKWVRLPKRKIRVGLPCLVEARLSRESADAIPVDVLLLQNDAELAPLALFPGSYTLLLRDAHHNSQQLRLKVRP
ncbi:MAG: hypothetical protein IT260_15825 [Saprospiraceae bacterium]|nr:hypothetical protein [Saprospiraceae bacterium]